MAMIKKGESFENAVVEVIDGKGSSCERCQAPLNMMTSTKGIVMCEKCGHDNPVKDME